MKAIAHMTVIRAVRRDEYRHDGLEDLMKWDTQKRDTRGLLGAKDRHKKEGHPQQDARDPALETLYFEAA